MQNMHAESRPGKTAILLITLCLTCPIAGLAEKADRDKPINIEADKVSLDDKQKVSVFEGNVVLTQGTLRIMSVKLTLTEDKAGNQHAVAVGKPASFRQKRDNSDEYVEGFSERMEYDSKIERLEMFTGAILKRNQDEVKGNYISYDSATEYYQVLGGGTPSSPSTNPGGRVSVIIKPKPKASAPAPSGAATPAKPADAGATSRE
jgi:lipopolysaccharide export system protein LptA